MALNFFCIKLYMYWLCSGAIEGLIRAKLQRYLGCARVNSVVSSCQHRNISILRSSIKPASTLHFSQTAPDYDVQINGLSPVLY